MRPHGPQVDDKWIFGRRRALLAVSFDDGATWTTVPTTNRSIIRAYQVS
jgi:hypothetical protein